MRYLAVLALGILTGLAFNHLPRYQIFRDLPKTPEGHTLKYRTYSHGQLVSEGEWT